jgi:uncharacterized OsmC-like protein
MKSSPRRIGSLIARIRIKEEGQKPDEKKSLKKIAEDCPVALSLHPGINQELSIEYY